MQCRRAAAAGMLTKSNRSGPRRLSASRPSRAAQERKRNAEADQDSGNSRAHQPAARARDERGRAPIHARTQVFSKKPVFCRIAAATRRLASAAALSPT